MVYDKPKNISLVYPHYKKNPKNPTNQTEAQTKPQNKIKQIRKQKNPPRKPGRNKIYLMRKF